jgi:hypothetical protein
MMKFLLFTALLLSTGSAFSPSKANSKKKLETTTTTTTTLFNVPPPSIDDKEAFKAFSNRQPAPASFFELQKDCIRSTKLAIRDGFQLLEVEFPPLPANILDLDDVSAYDVAIANLKLAVEYARGFSADKNVAIMFPDESEACIAVEKLTGKEDVGVTTDVEAGITISSLRRSEEGDDRIIKVRWRVLL